jgi:flagellar protein FlbD
LNDAEFILNPKHIETLEEHPDNTVIILVNDRKYVVKESAQEVIDLIVKYQNRIHIVSDIKMEGPKE